MIIFRNSLLGRYVLFPNYYYIDLYRVPNTARSDNTQTNYSTWKFHFQTGFVRITTALHSLGTNAKVEDVQTSSEGLRSSIDMNLIERTPAWSQLQLVCVYQEQLGCTGCL